MKTNPVVRWRAAAFVAWLWLLAIAGTSLWAAEPPATADEVAALRAEVKMLRATVERQAKQIEELKAENAKLKPVTGATASVKPATQPAVASQTSNRQTTLKDLPLGARDADAQLRNMVGVRVFGPTVVRTIKPIPDDLGHYLIEVAETTGKEAGLYRRWEGGQWVMVVCVLKAPEATALGLSKDDSLNVAGDVERVEIVPPTKDTIKIVKLHLTNVKAR